MRMPRLMSCIKVSSKSLFSSCFSATTSCMKRMRGSVVTLRSTSGSEAIVQCLYHECDSAFPVSGFEVFDDQRLQLRPNFTAVDGNTPCKHFDRVVKRVMLLEAVDHVLRKQHVEIDVA